MENNKYQQEQSYTNKKEIQCLIVIMKILRLLINKVLTFKI